MRLLRHLLPRTRRSGTTGPGYALMPAVLAPLELDYDPRVAQLARQCR
jgi:hypothetical protein